MAGMDIINRALRLRNHNEHVIELADDFRLDLDFDQLLIGGVQQGRNVISGESNLTLTAALSGSLILMDDATQAFTLPAIGEDEIGIWFELVSTVAATTTTITAATGDLLTGVARISSTTAGGDDSFNPDGSNDLIITMNGTTQGGLIGSRVVLTAIGEDSWLVNYEGVGSGTIVTPFS